MSVLSELQFRDHLDDADPLGYRAHQFTAEAHGETVGYATAYTKPHEVDLGSLWVHPNYRGHGVAGSLLDHVTSRYADRPTVLHPLPFEDRGSPKGLTSGQLRMFYSNHGFHTDPNSRNGLMVRRPA